MRLPINELKGVGIKIADRLEALHIHYVQDLLFHLPLRYEDRTQLTPIAQLKIAHKALFEGEIISGRIQYGKRRSLVCVIGDDTTQIQLRFFHFTSRQAETLTTEGVTLRCFGEVRAPFQRGLCEVVHPEYRCGAQKDELALADSLTPIYSTTSGLQQTTWRKLMRQALLLLQADPPIDYFTEQPYTLTEALCYLHQPPTDAPVDSLLAGTHPAQKRLAFEELVAHQLGLTQLRYSVKKKQAPCFNNKPQLQQQLLNALPFQLTEAQTRVVQEINVDIAAPSPMLRLVQGDVGSGKTIVAALSLLQAVQHGYQAALMAPTEILAEQHCRTLKSWFTSLGVRIAWISGSLTGKKYESVLQCIAEYQVDVVVGTHALFQQKVHFAKLGLLVIDEQHRFGVHQRLALKQKGENEEFAPHQLIMTATPIPRTLAMTAYADLDVSMIDQLPAGRKPIQTVLLSKNKREQIIERMRVTCNQGAQVYWVCTLIEDSETLKAEAATQAWQNLSAALPELNIGLVHGRLKAADKEAQMARFKSGELHVLVATTVIEVGVDVPNASVMVIENAERLGLAQLHQLRGRVGRGQRESFCVLLYQPPLSTVAKQRLAVMRDHRDGFIIAEQDLKMRGPGEVLGVRQTGLLRLRVADLMRDESLLPTVKSAAANLVQHQPEAVEVLAQRWLQGTLNYMEV